MQVKSVKKKLLRFLGSSLIVPVINLLCKTLRIVEINKDKIKDSKLDNKNAVFAFWHGTMLVPWFLLKQYRPSTIISRSNDGDILTKILNFWGYRVKRGSSSQGGKEVLEDLIKEAVEKQFIAITPDGPRGPEKIMKAGAVVLAKKTGIPLILIGINYKKKLKLNSWDKFEVPYFFSKVAVVYSEPFYLDEQLTFDETNKKIQIMSDKLTQLQIEAEKYC